MLPSFLIIGAQRAGTTSLFYYLHRHPHVVHPTGQEDSVAWPKEIHFFDEKYWRGVDWYRSFFPLAAQRRLARLRGGDLVPAEATPSYLFHPAVPERVAATMPEVRLVALLRNPVERAHSHYQLMFRTGREKLSFEEALAVEDERLEGQVERMLADPRYRSRHHRHHSYFSRGLYAEQLERWLAHFPREQLLVLRAEDFLARPAEVYRDVLRFLVLAEWLPEGFPPRNIGSRAPIDPAVRARLEHRYAEPNSRLVRLLGDGFTWDGPAHGSAEEAEAHVAPGRRAQEL